MVSGLRRSGQERMEYSEYHKGVAMEKFCVLTDKNLCVVTLPRSTHMQMCSLVSSEEGL